MQQVASGCERSVFPAFSKLAVKLLVTPIGTASVERSFSNFNRIVTDTCSCLLQINQDCLLRLSSEGHREPDAAFLEATCYSEWIKQPRRFTHFTR
jgi:hypothetical protein